MIATSKSAVGDASVVTLTRTDTTLYNSQKAEKGMSGAVWKQATHHAQTAAGAARSYCLRKTLIRGCWPPQNKFCDG